MSEPQQTPGLDISNQKESVGVAKPDLDKLKNLPTVFENLSDCTININL